LERWSAINLKIIHILAMQTDVVAIQSIVPTLVEVTLRARIARVNNTAGRAIQSVYVRAVLEKISSASLLMVPVESTLF
jgi:hypothetical protein